MVDDGGKITRRHNAFFVGSDGSQFTTAYISPQPVRFIIEYDDVDQRYTSISLILGRERIQAIPITLIDPSQPAGRIPARASAGAPGMQPPAGRANGVTELSSTEIKTVTKICPALVALDFRRGPGRGFFILSERTCPTRTGFRRLLPQPTQRGFRFSTGLATTPLRTPKSQ